MNPDLARSDRLEAVRAAARAWRRAGMIDDGALAAIASRYPDDRVRVGPVFRVLLFLFTVLAVSAGYGFLLMLNSGLHHSEGFIAALALLTGGAMAAATEVQLGRLRRRQGGIEAATSFLAVGYLLGSVAWWESWSHDLAFRDALAILCLVAAVLLAAAAWRWGYPLYAGGAAAALLVAVARLPFGRLLWIVLPVLAIPWLLRLADSPRLPPSHRLSFIAVLLVALSGLYLAVHIGSWEAQLIEEIGRDASAPPRRDLLWWLAVVATAVVPLVLLAAGLRRRRYPLLLMGAATAVASLVTLRFYVHLAPLWVVLAASGALLVAIVLALRRYLESGAAGERHGFTAAPLFQDAARRRVLEAAAAAVTLAPEAPSIRQEPKLQGGGGEFGGGGASGGF